MFPSTPHILYYNFQLIRYNLPHFFSPLSKLYDSFIMNLFQFVQIFLLFTFLIPELNQNFHIFLFPQNLFLKFQFFLKAKVFINQFFQIKKFIHFISKYFFLLLSILIYEFYHKSIHHVLKVHFRIQFKLNL